MQVLFTPRAAEEIDRLPKVIRARIHGLIERLKRWPDVSGVKALSGKLAGHYRVRTGDYRLQFRVTAEAVLIERIGHRDGFYED